MKSLVIKSCVVALAALFSSTASAAEATWTGTGYNDIVSDAAHWGGILPDLDNGTTTATFVAPPGGGTSQMFDRDISLYGMKIRINESQKTWSMKGTGTITLGAGGITDITTVGRYSVVFAPLCFTADCSIAASGMVQLYINGPVNCSDPAHPPTLTKTGTKPLYLQKDASSSSTFTGDFIVSEGYILFYDTVDPLGQTGTIHLNGDAYVNFSGSGTKTNSSAKNIVVAADSTCDTPFYCGTWPAAPFVQSGAVTNNRTSASRIQVGVGAVVDKSCSLIFSGGYVGNGEHLVVLGGTDINRTYVLEFADKPIVLTGQTIRPHYGTVPEKSGTVIFSAPTNDIARLGWDNETQRWHRVDIKFGCDWAFDSTMTAMNLGHHSLAVDLAGTEQRIGNFSAREFEEGHFATITNTSEMAATLHITQSGTAYEQQAVFGGLLNLEKSGTTDLLIGRANTAKGNITLTEGTMTFTASGSWPDARTVSIAPGTTMTVANAATFGNKTMVSIASGGKLACNTAGGSFRLTVATLQVAGVQKASGIYTPSDLPGVFEGDNCELKILYSCIVELDNGILTVPAGGNVTIGDDTMFSEDLVGIAVGAGGTVTLNGAYSSLKLDSFTYDGAPLYGSLTGAANPDPGPYTPTAAIAGTGHVYVERPTVAGVTATWTGGGADTKTTTAANWQGGLPDLASGTTIADFGTGGTSASVVGAPFLNGVKISRNVAFRVDADSPSTLLHLGSGGITIGADALYNTYYYLNPDLYIENNQTWDGGATLRKFVVAGNLRCDPLAKPTITLTGASWFFINGGNDGTDSGFTGTIKCNTSTSVLLGGTEPVGKHARIEVASGLLIAQSLNAYPAVVSTPIDFTTTETGYRFRTWIGNATYLGPISYVGDIRIMVHDNLMMMLCGGLTGKSDTQIHLTGKTTTEGRSTLVISNQPWVATHFMRASEGSTNKYGQYGQVVFAVASNNFASLGSPNLNEQWNTADLVTTVDWAFDKTEMPLYWGHSSTFDLCGTQQRVGMLKMIPTAGQTPPAVTNSSAKAAKLYLNQIADWQQDGTIGGKLDVSIAGAYTTTFASPVMAEGELEVVNGTVAFTSTGSWRGATNVTVNGASAKIVIANPKTLDKYARLNLDNSGKIEIASGVEQQVMSLYVDGVLQGDGIYTATKRPDLVSGGGKLQVGKVGTLFVVR